MIIKIKAGLGNQMFQYAFGRALSLKNNESLCLDVSHYNNQSEREAKREFLLNNFTIQATILSQEDVERYNSPLSIYLRKLYNKITNDKPYTFYPSLLRSHKKYYEGYWLNQKYFLDYADSIRSDFSLKEKMSQQGEENLAAIKRCKEAQEESVSLHIRRGDFVTNPHSAFNGVLGVPYYQKALDTIAQKLPQQRLHLFVFSDDIQWAKENLTFPYPMDFVSGPEIKDYEELILMSTCSHNIIANSTFSWWGAWLNANPKKIVIVTKQWLKDSTTKDLDIAPPEWITIDP